MAYYVAASDVNMRGFLSYGTGIKTGVPEFHSSVRHAANFGTLEEASVAAERANLVCYAVLESA